MTDGTGDLARLRAQTDDQARAAQRQADAVRDLCGVVARLQQSGWPVLVEVRDAPLRVWLEADLGLPGVPVPEAGPAPVVVIEDDGAEAAGDAHAPVPEENSGVVVPCAAPELLPAACKPAAAVATVAGVAAGRAAAGGVSSPPPAVAAARPAQPRAAIWTDADLLMLVAGRGARVPMPDLAVRLGRGADACWTRLGKLKADGVTLADLRARVGEAADAIEGAAVRGAVVAGAPVAKIPRAPNWTVVEELQLLSGMLAKVPMDALARHIGREKTACYARLRVLKAQHVSMKALREEIGPGAAQIEAAVVALSATEPPPLPRKAWTAEEEAEVARLRGEGKTLAQVAQAMGRTRSSLSVRLSERATGKRAAPPPAVEVRAPVVAEVAPAPEREAVAVAAPVVAELAPAPAPAPVMVVEAEADWTVPADLPDLRPAAQVVVEAPPLGATLSGDLHRRLDGLEREGRAAGWTPALDLALLEGLTRGSKLGFVAQDIGMDARACKLRFAALVPQADFAAQAAMLKALTERVAMARQVAA